MLPSCLARVLFNGFSPAMLVRKSHQILKRSCSSNLEKLIGSEFEKDCAGMANKLSNVLTPAQKVILFGVLKQQQESKIPGCSEEYVDELYKSALQSKWVSRLCNFQDCMQEWWGSTCRGKFRDVMQAMGSVDKSKTSEDIPSPKALYMVLYAVLNYFLWYFYI